MTFAGLLVHPLAIVTPTTPDPDDVDEYGHPVAGGPTTVLVSGMVQPKSARELALASQGGAEVSDHTIFLLPRQLSSAAHIADADGSGELAGGRRFEIDGIRSFEFGSVPHLEVDCRLVGSTEGPTVPGS
jgi:hypothetical protein